MTAPQTPIYILSREGYHYAGDSWEPKDRPRISVFSNVETLITNLMTKDGLGRLAAERVIRMGELTVGKNNWLSIYEHVLNPTSDGVDTEWDPIGTPFTSDLDLKGAEAVALEFMYARHLVPTGLRSPCTTRCRHPYWIFLIREKPYIACSDEHCGLAFNVSKITDDLPKWTEYLNKYSSRDCRDYEQLWENRLAEAQKYWRFCLFKSKSPFYVIDGSCFITLLEKACDGKASDEYFVVGKLALVGEGILIAVALGETDQDVIKAMGLRSLTFVDENKNCLPPIPPGATLYTYKQVYGVKIELGKPLLQVKSDDKLPLPQ